jgi:6-pyruvoyltetrahydropterin/6-carboxytetrahydropterin synthase
MAVDRPIAYLTRRETFSAAHRLWSERLTAEQNLALFGACAREHGHGHNYALEVTVRGEIDPATGVVINLTAVRDAVRALVIDGVDHRHLNLDATPCSGVNPTAENLAGVFWSLLQSHFGDLLHRIRLYETDKNWVDYQGE